jgi:uncharacterized protein
MKPIPLKSFSILLLLVILFSSCHQERYIFQPEKLPAGYVYNYNQPFREINFKVDDKTTVNGLLFQVPKSKGLVFYLHGNAGSLRTWGYNADVYLKNHYDFFVMDYRGYGKSGGEISSEKQLYRDIQTVYDSLITMYNEDSTIIIGFSIGSGLAANLASTNHPKMLILKAPYYSLPDLVHHNWSVPRFLVAYKIKTFKYLAHTKCPVYIFHGNQDEVIYVGSSYKLQKYLKPNDRLFILDDQKHNGINGNKDYQRELEKILK